MAPPAAKRQKRSNADDLICPISLELPIDPVTAEDGHVYERSAIEEYFRGKPARKVPSPLTRKLIGKKLLPALRTKNHIETLIENRVIKGDLAAKWKDKVKQKKKMKELLDKAKKGGVKAMYNVGNNYYIGQYGFQEDDELAYFWLQKAHSAGCVKATALVGELLLKGHGVAENHVQGLTYLGVAAKESDFAAYCLGMAFADGDYGLPTDTEEARRWLQLVVNGTCTHVHLGEDSHKEAKERLKDLKIKPSHS